MSSYSNIVVHNIVSIYKQRFHKYPSLSELSKFEARIEKTLKPSRISWRRSLIASCTLADYHEADVLRGEIKAMQTPAQTIDGNIDELKAKKAAISMDAIKAATIAAEERKLDARRIQIQARIDELKHELDVIKAFGSDDFKHVHAAISSNDEQPPIIAQYIASMYPFMKRFANDYEQWWYSYRYDIEGFHNGYLGRIEDELEALNNELQGLQLNMKAVDNSSMAEYQQSTYTINQELRHWERLKRLKQKAQEADAAYFNRICTYSTDLDSVVESVSAWLDSAVSDMSDSFPTTLSNMIKDVILNHTANNKDLFNGTVKTACEKRISSKSYEAINQWLLQWKQYIYDEVLDNIPAIDNVPVAEYILYTHIDNAINAMHDGLVSRLRGIISIDDGVTIKDRVSARIIAQNLTSKINESFKRQGGWGKWCMDPDVKYNINFHIQQLIDEWNATLDEPLPVELQEEAEEAEEAEAEATEQRTMEQFIKSLSDNEFTVDELTSLYNNFFGLDIATQRFSREPGIKDYFKTYRKTINTKKYTMYKLL
jgi:hypothetical protein